MIKDKIKHLRQLTAIRKSFKKNKKIVVFTNGCFDLLHYGHVKYLEAAKDKGDILIVGINSDKSLKGIKGLKRPIIYQKDRAAIIAALESVNYVVIFDTPTPLTLIKQLKPDVLAKGADWKVKDIVGAKIAKQYGGKIIRIKVVGRYSSTKLIKTIVKKYRGAKKDTKAT
ncbi:MAG: D-glycero-beta-D-manno-heptose 1-phosphate adenylyltransferase [Candidatus Omnitrophota bacterium]